MVWSLLMDYKPFGFGNGFTVDFDYKYPFGQYGFGKGIGLV